MSLWDKYSELIGLPTAPSSLRIAQVPQTLLTEAAETVGGVLGGLSMMSKEGLQVAKEELFEGAKDIASIPQQIVGGDISRMARPSESLGVGGVPGFLLDVAGDPLNLLFVGPAQKSALAKTKKTVPLLERFGTRLYQSLFRPSQKKVAKEYMRLGKEIDGIVKETPELLGKNLAAYGVKGSLERMLRTMNQRIATLGDELGKVVEKSKAKVDITGILNQLDDLMKSYQRAGKKDVVRMIQSKIDELQKMGTKLISVDDAVQIRKIFDDLRLTAGGALSEAQSAEQRVFRLISNGLRNQINKLPGRIGTLNKELSTYYEGILALGKVAAKESERVLSPLTLREFFPYLKVSLGPFAKTKTAVGKAAIDLSNALQVPMSKVKSALMTILPSTLRNILD